MMRPQVDSDSEDELPGGWEQKTTADGNVYFVNSLDKKTQWTHPRTGRKKIVPAEMPFGWRQTQDDAGRTVYIHKEDGRSSYVDPRLAFARDEKTHVHDFRQRFDSSSTAYQVLHGVDLSGKTAVVTGCNAGIGYETVKSMARHGCKVVMANRNMAATSEAIAQIVAETGAAPESLVPMQLDLASLASVKKFALLAKTKLSGGIDLLILNAGVFGLPYGETEDGIETTTQVNHVSHTLLALLLAPLLARRSRLVLVSSESHRMASFKDGFSSGSLSLSPEKYSAMMAYNNSKLFNVLTAKLDGMMRPQVDSDSEDELPGGWEQKTTADGNVYFVNSLDKKTQWTHPRTGRKKIVPAEMPFGWRQTQDDAGRTVYIHKEDGRSSYVDPRLAFARDEKTHVHDFRQRFDSSSTAYQVLHGVDLSGKTAVVTGCNAGIGYETVKSMARHGCKVVMANRNMAATSEAIAQIVAETGAAPESLVPMQLDLASLASVKKFALLAKTKLSGGIDLLILNAGVFGLPYGETEDGIETTTQVNHVSHTLLALLLAPLLARRSRLVLVSSESHRMASFKDGFSSGSLSLSPEKYSAMMAYNNSKLFNVLTAKVLSEELRDRDIYVNSLHPGNMVYTKLCHSWWLYRLAFQLVRPFTKSLQQAAATTVYAAVAPELDGVTGLYFNNCFYCQESALARDADLARMVFSLTLSLIEQRVGSEGIQPYLQKYKVAT